jgi:hypothetical protein
MSRRAARIASAIFVNILAGIPLVMLAHAEPVPADNCLSSPKGETPAGSHWRYRTDHVNKRTCWYLRREDGSVAQVVPQASAPEPAPAAKPALVDARAEVRPQATVREDTSAANPLANTTAGPIINSAGNNASSTNASVWNSPAPVATRWPDLPPSVSAPKTEVAAADPTNATNDAAQPAAVAPAAASPTASVVDLPIKPEMIPILIAATLGVLALAGAAGLISRRYRRRVRHRKATSARAPIWETTDDDRIVLSDYPAIDDREYRPRFARGVPSATASRRPAPEFVQRAPRRAARR